MSLQRANFDYCKYCKHQARPVSRLLNQCEWEVIKRLPFFSLETSILVWVLVDSLGVSRVVVFWLILSAGWPVSTPLEVIVPPARNGLIKPINCINYVCSGHIKVSNLSSLYHYQPSTCSIATHETFHQSSLLLSVLLPARPRRPRSTERVHSWSSHDLNHLKSEGGDVVLDLVHIVLSHSLILRLPLLLGHISPH